MFRHLSLIVISTAVYGLALGWWRSVEMALYVAAKLPVVFVGSTLVVSTFAWMAGLLKMLFRSPCALDDVATGNWSRIVRFAAASLLCGLVWEMWNINSFTKWIYAVPYVHRFQYFEMPLLGLFGYIPFGIECLVVTAAWMKRMSLAY